MRSAEPPRGVQGAQPPGNFGRVTDKTPNSFTDFTRSRNPSTKRCGQNGRLLLRSQVYRGVPAPADRWRRMTSDLSTPSSSPVVLLAPFSVPIRPVPLRRAHRPRNRQHTTHLHPGEVLWFAQTRADSLRARPKAASDFFDVLPTATAGHLIIWSSGT